MGPNVSPRRPRRLHLVLIAFVLVAAFCWPTVRRHLQAVAVLDQVATKPVPGLLLHFTHPVTVTDVTLPLADGPIRARLYAPADEPDAPPLVVLHGVHHLGMDEPRMIAFARAMASTGLRVLTPELPHIDDYHVDASTITTIGDTAAWFANNTNQPVGILGLSFSGGLSLMAAAEPTYAPHIKFVAAVGSQDSMERVAAFYRTGNDPRPDGTIEHLTPHEYGPLVIEYQHLQDFMPVNYTPQQVEAERLVLRDHLYEEPALEHAAMAKLPPDEAKLARELMDINSPETKALLAASELKHLDYATTVSPHGCLHYLKVPVYLLHGEGDNIIPAAESLWLAKDIPHGDLKAMLISPVISHLDMDGKGPTMMDNLRLTHFFAELLEASQS
ncbi:alpha/beta hydrolase [Granulicella sp. 5B5]|uniref:alpha/beta hydrolase n=1 Tax=Granulicella sp. 5B5 TaxID=1617967 RepID=UPI0015F61C24|nr:alpha/beta hydrolase [Granulicella sp. 5B5]QMV19256.1 alpha/beta hydrolase [Granulicella sp. 5B5]